MAISKSSAKRILLIFAAINALAILLLTGVTGIITDKNIDRTRELVLSYSADAALQRGMRIAAQSHLTPETKGSEILELISAKIKSDSSILGMILFSKTADESFFRVVDTGSNSSSFRIPVIRGQKVKEGTEENWIRKGLFDPTVETTPYSANENYWHNVYLPVKIKDNTYVLRIMISAAPAVFALDDLIASTTEVQIILIIVSGLLIIISLVSAFLFLRSYLMIISGITGYAKKAAAGDHNMVLNESASEEIFELALSFNSLVGELRDKERTINSLRERENEAIKSRNTAAAEEVRTELGKTIQSLEDELKRAVEEKERILAEESKTDELSLTFRKGVELLKSGSLDEAHTIFSALALVKPDGFGAHFNLGVVYAKKRMFEESLHAFEIARGINPAHTLTNDYIDKVTRLKKSYGISSL